MNAAERLPRYSSMSAPATNARSPAPARITTRTARSAAIASSWRSKARTIGVDSALSFSGRLNVRRTMQGSGDRESGVQGKSVYARVDLGGRRVNKKKKAQTYRMI